MSQSSPSAPSPEAPLRLALDGLDPDALLAAVDERLLPSAAPEELFVDDRPRSADAGWLDHWLPRSRRQLTAAFADGTFVALLRDPDPPEDAGRRGIVKVETPALEADPEALLELLRSLEFRLASCAPLSFAWKRQHDYVAPSFGGFHWPHGWACAFRGDGHDSLVSRRWLEHGPWRLLGGDGDTSTDISLVQFHDVDADPETALEQARPAHARMGISATGGFLPRPYHLSHDLGGVYVPEERQLRIVVHGREVSELEMLDACAVRTFQGLGPEQPVDSVAYVFMEEAPARAHLPRLWLRELQCRAVVDGTEVRLDGDWQPDFPKPEWVEALD